jgi:hypothetical protein
LAPADAAFAALGAGAGFDEVLAPDAAAGADAGFFFSSFLPAAKRRVLELCRHNLNFYDM